jgi:hypothetical protein
MIDKIGFNSIDECKQNIKYIQHSKYKNIKIPFEFATSYQELNKLIINKREKINKNKKFQTIKENKNIFNNVINKKLNLDIYNYTNDSFENTLKYIFYNIGIGTYVKIFNNEVQIFVPFINMNFKNNWGHLLNIDAKKFIDEKYENNKKEKNLYAKRDYIWFDKNRWLTNNCLIGHLKEDNGYSMRDSRITIYKYLLDKLCKTKKINNVEFFINKRDFPILTKDLTEPYFHIFDNYNIKLVKHVYNNHIPILSTCTSDKYADINIPTEDDCNIWLEKYYINSCTNNYKNIKNIKIIPWTKKIPTAIFRGTATGCGVTIKDNQRLQMAEISKIWETNNNYNENNNIDQYKFLDFGITKWNAREKKIIGKPITYIKPYTFKFKLSNSMSREDQMKYKYHILIDGHVAAFRLIWLLMFKSLILYVESEYNWSVWFQTLLKPYEHYIPIKKDLSNLADQIKWCKQNDNKCKKIAENSYNFYIKNVKNEKILDYMELLLNKISVKQNIIEIYKYIKPFNYKLNKQKYKFSIIVPFRDDENHKRLNQLNKFIPHMENFLSKLLKYNYIFEILIIEQSSHNIKFNRGKLLNIGYDIAKNNKSDYIILHDVDLLPYSNLLGYYAIYPDLPFHIAHIWKYYNYDTYFGGINSINIKQYNNINGFSNIINETGWGGEDDIFYNRIVKIHKLQILRPLNGNIKDIDEHEYNNTNKEFYKKIKDIKKNIKNNDFDNWDKDGINNLKYKILSSNKILNYTTIFNINFNISNIKVKKINEKKIIKVKK